MSSEAIRPSTLDGIKRLAKSLKVERGIQHVRALDEAAKAAGFQNFRHASNVLRSGAKQERPGGGHHLFLTAYWKEREGTRSGRETLSIWLSALWSELITPLQFRNHRGLRHFRAEGPDHLARERTNYSQSEARRAVCAAVRAFHFMEATRLRPSKSHSRIFPGGRSITTVPGCDHESLWYDGETKRYLLVDEPYEKSIEYRVEEREVWAREKGFVIVKPQWLGMYVPDQGSRLYLIADAKKGIPLQPIAAALDKLPPPFIEADWNGESAAMLPLFVSPGAIAAAEAAKDRPKAQARPAGARSTVGYVQTFVGPRRRPKGRMPIEAHVEVGRLLKSVLKGTFDRKGVYNRVDSIRSELDEWTQREYDHAELPNERFFDLYYRDSGSPVLRPLTVAERDDYQVSLVKAKEILVKHYPDCPPLRSLLKKVDAAAKSLQNWAA